MTMQNPAGAAVSREAGLDAIRALLASMGMTPTDLLADKPTPNAMPTFAEYIPAVSAAVSDGARRAYQPYWDRIVERWPDLRIDEPKPSDIEQFAEFIKRNAVSRRNSRSGRGAAEHFISALRCLYRHAVADEILNEADNVALRVAKPRRLPNARRALPDAALCEINSVASTTGNDPALDTLILRLHTETACRRGGALALRPCDLDPAQCLVRLREKGETVRWQPVSPTLMAHLVAHAREHCGDDPGGQLLRYATGKPITRRRYDYLWNRIGKHIPWVATQQISIHWLRHTTLTWVERHFGYAVARSFAGHASSSHDATTTTYVRADIHEVAAALATLTGEPHPLGSHG